MNTPDDPITGSSRSVPTDRAGIQRTVSTTGPAPLEPHASCVVVIRGPGLGQRVSLGEKPLLVGRDPEADLQITHPSVSRRHCEIWNCVAGHRIRDLGATNRTLLNLRELDEAELKDGDLITVGESVFKFVDGGSQEARYHAAVYQLATQDALTGLPNRRHFAETMERELARARRHHRALTLALIDLDHFKRINDDLGHLAGDQVLRRFGALLREQVRADDLPARIGGEEFALLMPESDLAAAQESAERIRQTVADSSFEGGGKALPLTISIGLASWNDRRDTVSALMRAADHALYRAKSDGRNRTCNED
ncbi:MAG: GGDEF domain-containing protein [Lysobacteraceae bacterium]